MSFVPDASVAIAWAFGDQLSESARPALELIRAGFAIAPGLWHFEIADALRKALAENQLSLSQVEAYLADLRTLDICLEAKALSVTVLFRLAEQFRVTTYDAAYLELALRKSSRLATLDQKLSRAAQQAGASLLLTV